MKLRRVVVKVGSSSVTDLHGHLDGLRLQNIVTMVHDAIRNYDAQIVLVSSGAVAAGRSQLGWTKAHDTMPEKQAAAAVGQGLLVDAYQKLFSQVQLNIGQLLLTRSDIEQRHRFTHMRNTVETLLRHGVVPIVNENDTVAVEEIRFGDNDTLASLVALATEADLLLILSDIDGLYTANPRQDKSATKLIDVWNIDEAIDRMAGGAGSSIGTGGMRTKIKAAKIAIDSGVDVIIAHHQEPNVLVQILQGKVVGTRFHAPPDPLSSRRSWVAHGSRVQGSLILDHGAVHALMHQSASLLLPGIERVCGTFSEGATVELSEENGRVIGKGMTNFASTDLISLLQRRQAGEKLQTLQEIVHRNHMALHKE